MEKEKNGILLESGTNEIEIMEFTIDGNLYGINVAKVREIMMAEKVHPMPHSHPAVEGIFKPRDTVITVVNLPKYLARRDVESRDKELFIITNFNKMFIAFRVHTVVGISHPEAGQHRFRRTRRSGHRHCPMRWRIGDHSGL